MNAWSVITVAMVWRSPAVNGFAALLGNITVAWQCCRGRPAMNMKKSSHLL